MTLKEKGKFSKFQYFSNGIIVMWEKPGPLFITKKILFLLFKVIEDVKFGIFLNA